MLERWTRAMVRLRLWVLAGWLLVLVAGIVAAGRLTPSLATSFAVPGTESERARTILADAFGERPDGTFTLVARVPRTSDPAARHAFATLLARAAATVPTARAGDVREGTKVLYGSVSTSLELQEAKRHTDRLRGAVADDTTDLDVLVTGQPAFQADVEPVVAADLRRGQLIAVGVALAVLLAVLGVSLAVVVPFVFAACSIGLTLTLVLLLAQRMTVATYVTNLVELIGLGLAIDYSLLVVLRQREELARGGSVEDATVRTVATAGRTAVFSGTAVAIGLGLLLVVPVPFIRSLGLGGLLLPLASIAALLTLQPALLALLGRRGISGRRRPGDRGAPASAGVWARIARAVMRHPVAALAAGAGVLVAASAPALSMSVTPGSLSALPSAMEASQGYALLRDGVGPGVITPTSVVVDTGAAGGADLPDVTAAVDRLGDRLFEDFGLVALGSGSDAPYVDGARRHTRLIAAGRSEYGAASSRAFVERLRAQDVPAARFPSDVEVMVGGVPAQGADFLSRTYAAFPWLVLASLLVTYVVLLRAFRSLLLPLKAVLLNALTVAATFGLLVGLFERGVGEPLGLAPGAIEGWVPVLLFAVLFGLSMDYEVFIVARMREVWDETHDGVTAITAGLERTGRIVSAAAVIMVGAFAGFVVGDVVGLQQLGVGLVIAVVLDATLVRMVLVPAAMTVAGRWNWWLPASVARLVHVAPSPLLPSRRASDG